jgi:hypothetical protein
MYNKIFNKFVRKYLNLPNWENIVQSDGVNVTVNGREVDPMQVARNAQLLKDDVILNAILNNIKIAAENSLRDSMTTEDLYFPKASLFVIGEIKNQIENLSLFLDRKKN